MRTAVSGFPTSRPGPYEITVRDAGFADARRSITLTVGAAVELNVSLDSRFCRNDVSVSDRRKCWNSTNPDRRYGAANRGYRPAAQRPQFSGYRRSLVPGVSPTNTASNQLFAETSAVPGQGISVNSQRNFSNSFIVDGLSANDDAAGLSGLFYGLDVVNEFQVVTSGGQAEFGRALGGYMNVITKSGTNTLHGDLYGYFRNQRLNAANALSHTALPVTQAQYGASLGGPIVRDRTFYFGNFEQRELESVRPDHDLARQCGRDQRPAACRRLSGPADFDGHLSESRSHDDGSWQRSIISSTRAINSASATAFMTSTAGTRAAPAA